MGLEKTPTFEKYEDDSSEGVPDEPPEELEPTPYLSTDVYLNSSIIFPRGNRIAQEKVVRRKRGADGIQLDRKTKIPFLILVNM